MAILEINLEKPALVEERKYPGASDSGSQSSSSSGSSKGKLLGLLVVLAGVAALAWKLKSSSGSKYEHEEKYEHGPEPEIGGDEGGVRSKVTGMVGLAVALVSLVAVVRKVRS